jgi:hypothetical protein
MRIAGPSPKLFSSGCFLMSEIILPGAAAAVKAIQELPARDHARHHPNASRVAFVMRAALIAVIAAIAVAVSLIATIDPNIASLVAP